MKFNYKDMLNQYLTNIFMLKNNINNLHFNVKGEGSSSFHESLNQDIQEFQNIYDKLAELIKKIGGYPIMNIEEIKNISTIKEISSKDYNLLEAENILLKDLQIINNMNNQVGEYAINNYDLPSINLILEINKYISNRIWLMEMNK